MAECEVREEEEARIEEGAPPRDVDSYSEWQYTALPDTLTLIQFYRSYLIGQTAGMGSALSLEAVRAALDIEEVPKRAWAEVTQALIALHELVVKHAKRRRQPKWPKK